MSEQQIKSEDNKSPETEKNRSSDKKKYRSKQRFKNRKKKPMISPGTDVPRLQNSRDLLKA